MKRFLLLALICLLGAGCVHKEPLCGNMVFIFIENEVRKVEANFRDDRLLLSDVIIRGSMTQWRPGPLWKAQGYFTLSAELESVEPVENVEVAVVYGRQGAAGYSSVPIFQSESFVVKKSLAAFDVGGEIPDARIVLYFGKKGDPMRREIEVNDLWKSRPNLSLQRNASTMSSSPIKSPVRHG